MNAEAFDIVDRIVQSDDLQFAAVAEPASTWRMASDRPRVWRIASLTLPQPLPPSCPPRSRHSTLVSAVGIQA